MISTGEQRRFNLNHVSIFLLQQALSQVKQQKRELQHKDSVIRVLTSQRDESIATLKLHGLSVPSQVPSKLPSALVYCTGKSARSMIVLKPRQADNLRKYKIKQIPKIDILYSRYSRKNKKTTESVIFRLYSKDIVKPMVNNVLTKPMV